MEQITDKVVVITGAASGIGRGMAEAFAQAGARLVLADINEARLKEVARALNIDDRLVTLPTDLRDPESVEALAQYTYDSFGIVHILCNNAGVACNGLLWEQSLEDWDWIFNGNIRSTIHCLRSFVPRLLAQEDAAHIINTASMLGLSSAPLTGAYGASKHAMIAISETLRMDLQLLDANIEVSTLCPGPVKTNVHEEPGRGPVTTTTNNELVAQVDLALKAVVADGMDPRQVGDRVVEAVKQGQCWILPAAEFIENAEQRLAAIKSAVNG